MVISESMKYVKWNSRIMDTWNLSMSTDHMSTLSNIACISLVCKSLKFLWGNDFMTLQNYVMPVASNLLILTTDSLGLVNGTCFMKNESFFFRICTDFIIEMPCRACQSIGYGWQTRLLPSSWTTPIKALNHSKDIFLCFLWLLSNFRFTVIIFMFVITF